MLSVDDLKRRIRGFLERFFRTADLPDGEDFFASGRVNSLLAIELVLFLEKDLKLRVENEDLTRENFRSVDAIAGLASRKLARHSA
jgi:methoxymalonate biosynthesis acyl carrier protein